MDFYCKQRICVPGGVWHGKVLEGVSGIVDLCKKIDSPGAVVCKDRPKITAVCTDGCFIKRYNLPGFLTRLRRRFKRPRPLLALDGAAALETLGIATPQVLAALIESGSWFFRREYLVTRELAADDQLFSRICTPGTAETSWNVLLDKVLPPLCRMHDAGWSHGDLSLRNIFLTAGAAEAGFIDLDGMRHRRGGLTIRHRAAEVARLVSSFMHYTRNVSAGATLVEDAVRRYNALTAEALTPETVTGAMGNMLRRVEKLVDKQAEQN
ncbi:MAG: phosphotransferase [Lentisphaeria bacterium]|nr:phosphotransferase [Lentisphaeria bacterium]